jgi:hypothetical protein
MLLLALALVAFLFTRNNEPLTLQETRAVKGVLSELPDIADIGEGTHHVRFKLMGYNDQFDFVGCSFNSHVIGLVKELRVGDSVFLRTANKSGSINWSWSGKRHDNFTVLQAWNPRVGSLMDVDQYNACANRQSNYLIPFLCAMLVLIAVARGLHTWRERERDLELKNLKYNHPIDAVITLKPDFTSYMVRKSYLPLMMIGLGVFNIYRKPGHDPDMIDYWLLVGGVLIQGWHMYAHRFTRYTVSRNEIEIRSLKFPFDHDTDRISYSSIKTVNYRRSIFEGGQNVGTVMLDLGQTDGDGDKVYTQLIGVEKFQEVAALILKRMKE